MIIKITLSVSNYISLMIDETKHEDGGSPDIIRTGNWTWWTLNYTQFNRPLRFEVSDPYKSVIWIMNSCNRYNINCHTLTFMIITYINSNIINTIIIYTLGKTATFVFVDVRKPDFYSIFCWSAYGDILSLWCSVPVCGVCLLVNLTI